MLKLEHAQGLRLHSNIVTAVGTNRMGRVTTRVAAGAQVLSS
jgi:hypothetical protein